MSLQDRPAGAELLEAVAGFLELDAAPALDARLRFHARVAANVLRVVQREWALEPVQRERQRMVLAALLAHEGEPAALWAELAAAIRDGRLDDRRAELVAALREITAQKLAIANPGYVEEA
ncbi:MAG TPA: DUF6285 domain-containing protein [Candidatus Dormibacteraeota bacterium]|nr:DUF6285 domain-containing protein [Candidatus Dormibacteraeota bacterium]